MALAELITVLALLQFFYFGYLVAAARGRYQIKAPAVSGNDMFERYYRVQMNTLEQLVLFLPALWMTVGHLPELWLGALGLLYLVGRFLYQRRYVAEPKSRGPGFTLTAIAVLALLAIDLYAAIRALIAR